MNMALKPTAVLKTNILRLPQQYAEYERRGQREKAATVLRILQASRAELDRRGLG